MPNSTITIKINGDSRGAVKAAAEVEKSISRLSKAQNGIYNPKVNNTSFKEFTNLTDKQLLAVRQLSKERQRLTELDLKTVGQAKTAELKVFEATEKSKLKLVEQAVKARTQAENNEFRASEAAKRREFSEYQRLEREKTKVAQEQARKRSSFSAERIGGGINSAGQGLQSGGATLSAAVTAPLVAIATLGIKAALELDAVRTKMTALVGDADKANAKITELRNLANNSVGVTQEAALNTFTQLKGIGGIADETINKVIKSLGKLNATFKIDDIAGFNQNLNQIFTQGFERSDIKEAIGRVPFFEQLLESAFGTKDQAKLKQLKESGKLTLDGFLSGLSDAISNDQRIANVGENLTVKLAKSFERLNVALAPLGEVILNTVVPIFEQLSPYILQAANYFQSLEPSVQRNVVIFGALLAALGPVLIVLGSAVVAVGGLVTAFGTLSGIVPEILAVVAVIATIGATIAAAYEVYQTNFGGIRDFTESVASIIVSYWNQAMRQIAEITQSATVQVSEYWQANGEDITHAVEVVSSNIKEVFTRILDFYSNNAETIQAITKTAWDAIKTIISGVITNIGAIIKLLAAVINGDFSKAWEATKQIITNAVAVWGKIIAGSGALLYNALIIAFKAAFAVMSYVYQEAAQIGVNLASGLIAGIQSKAGELYATARNTVDTVLNIMRITGVIHSPSEKTKEIGQFLGEGLAVGLENKVGRVKSAGKKLADETIKSLAEAIKGFDKLSGASPAQIGRIQQTSRISDATSSQSEIIKLRGSLGSGNFNPLPSTVGGTEAELTRLQSLKKAADDFDKSLEEIGKTSRDNAETLLKEAEDHQQYLDNIEKSGAINLINAQKENALIGVTDEFEQQRIENYYNLQELRQQLANDGWYDEEIDKAVELQKVEGARILEFKRLSQIRKQTLGAQNLGKDLDEQISALQRGGRELTAYEKTIKELSDGYKDLNPAVRDSLLTKAETIDAIKSAQQAYAKLKDIVGGAVDAFASGGFKGLFDHIKQQFKQFLVDLATSFITSKFAKLFGGGTGGQSQGGGLFGGLLGGLFGRGGQGGGAASGLNLGSIFGGSQGGGIFNFGGGSSGGGFGIGGGSAHEALHAGASGGGFLGGLQGLAPLLGIGLGSQIGGGSGAGGILGGLGGGLLGSVGAAFGSSSTALGGAFGSIGGFLGISGAATLGIGAAVGGAVLLASYFIGRNSRRKKEEKLRTEYLQSAFSGLGGFDELIKQVKAQQIQPPESALTTGVNLAKQIHDAYIAQASALKDSKTRGIALKDVSRVDSLSSQKMEELKKAVSMAQSNLSRQNRLIPEFASGAYIDPKIYNGMIAGRFDGRDSLIARLSHGEMVLNPGQIRAVISRAGQDVFDGVVPNYKQSNPTPQTSFAAGGYVNPQPTIFQPIVEVHISENDISEVVFKANASDAGKRQTFKIIKDGKKVGEI